MDVCQRFPYFRAVATTFALKYKIQHNEREFNMRKRKKNSLGIYVTLLILNVVF